MTFLSAPVVRDGAIRATVHTNGAGTVTAFGYAGNVHQIPVWITSCPRKADPPPDYGMTPCAVSDGGTPPWSPDMSGRLLGRAALTEPAHGGTGDLVVPISPADADRFDRSGHLLVSFVTAGGEVQALDVTPR